MRDRDTLCHPCECQNLRERIYRIESQLRLWKVLFALPILALVILFCGGSKLLEDIPQLVKAQTGFMVSDKEGRMRIFLGVDDAGEWGLHFMDENGVQKLALGFSEKDKQKSWGLMVLEKQNDYSFHGCLDDGSNGLHFFRNDVARLSVGHNPKGYPGLIARDEDGNQRLLLGESDKPGAAHHYGVRMSDKEQKTHVQLSATDRGDPALQFFDAGTHRRIALGVQGDKARFIMRGHDDADRLNVEVRSDDSSIFEMRDKNNNIVRLPK
jgi:hypothetical protein